MAAENGSSAKRAELLALYDAAVAAAHPDVCLPAHLPRLPQGGRLYVVGAGKAAAAMAVAAEAHYRREGVLDRVTGFTTAPHGTLESLAGPRPSVIEIVSARHPTPDEASVQAAERTLALVAKATERDLVLVMLSGGASALWAAPAAGLSLDAKTGLTRGLLKCGADIHEMNTVRRHVSRIKGGRLRKAARAPMLTLAISDVPGDDPATIGSGPTVPDPTTLADARAVLDRRRPAMEALGLTVPSSIGAALADPANETPKPGDPAFASAEYRIIATPAAALAAAAALARRSGYEVIDLGDAVVGEAREVAKSHAKLAPRGQGGGPPHRHSQRRGALRHRAQCPRPRRAQPGVCAGPDAGFGGGAGHLGAGSRYRRHRWRLRPGDGSGGCHRRRGHGCRRAPPKRPEVPRQ